MEESVVFILWLRNRGFERSRVGPPGLLLPKLVDGGIGIRHYIYWILLNFYLIWDLDFIFLVNKMDKKFYMLWK
jgi:hypothetical protein